MMKRILAMLFCGCVAVASGPTVMAFSPVDEKEVRRGDGEKIQRGNGEQICYKIPKCGQRCAQAFQDGTNFRVTSVEVYLLHNGLVAGRSGPIDQGNMNMADYRSDLSDAAEDAIIDAEMEDLEPTDNFSPSPIDVFYEMTTGLSSVFPEIDREDDRISTMIAYEKKCEEAGCECVWEGDPQDRDDTTRRRRTKTYQRVVPVGRGEYTYQIIWTVTFDGWDLRWQWGACKHFF